MYTYFIIALRLYAGSGKVIGPTASLEVRSSVQRLTRVPAPAVDSKKGFTDYMHGTRTSFTA